MSHTKNRNLAAVGLLIACLAGLVLICFACSGRASTSDSSEAVEALGKHYRESHDYYSLTRLLPYLELRRRTRAEIERLLGTPAYSPMPHLSYYPTDRTVAVACPEGSLPEEESCATRDSKQVSPLHSFPVILVVSYLESEGQPYADDRLDSILLGPVGE
jgi:hypothetical protein